MSKKVILTGLRANGELHLGNYIGSMKAMAERQNLLEPSDELHMFVADLHSFTTPADHDQLYQNVLNNIRMYIAAGLDPEHSQTILRRQSYVKGHTELTWILNCFTYMGEASRMVEFKQKSERLGDKAVSIGLFDYPVLMAADILLYDTTYIPLGDDQKQHMELTRTIAERFNNKFGNVFTVPASWDDQIKFTNRDISPRIRSLSKPENKMSKSIDDPSGTILMTEDPERAANKIMTATTDSVGEIHFDFKSQPGISNLLQLASTLEAVSLGEINERWEGQTTYGQLKQHVAGLVKNTLQQFQEKMKDISEAQVEDYLAKGEKQAQTVADATLSRAYKAIGLRR